jgi:hypothetical protein
VNRTEIRLHPKKQQWHMIEKDRRLKNLIVW